MNMTEKQEGAYPVLARHLQDDVPNYKVHGLLGANLAKFGDFPRAMRAEMALAWGSHPEVEVDNLAGAWGEFTRGAYIIKVSKDLVQKFEGYFGPIYKAIDAGDDKTAEKLKKQAEGDSDFVRHQPWAGEKNGVELVLDVVLLTLVVAWGEDAFATTKGGMDPKRVFKFQEAFWGKVLTPAARIVLK